MSDLMVDGVRLNVTTVGTGSPPVVFLHGLVMDNLSSWYFTAGTRVGAFTRAILLDLRGHGRSERPATGYTVARMVADVVGVLDALDVTEPVLLVGNSFGGQIAAAFAVAHPERTAGIALLDAHLGRDGWGDAMAGTLSLEGEARDTMIATHFADWLGRHSERKRNRLASNAQALVYGTSLVADLQASPGLDDAQLAALTMPVLALYGERSDILSEARRLEACVPHADVRVLPGASHSLMWEATEEVIAALVTWVAACR